MPKAAPVEFTIAAAESGTEIFLIDGTFTLVKKGIGRDTFSAPPGIYKIKARSGMAVAERMVIVRAGMAPIALDPVRITSAMPLSLSTKTHEYHEATASGMAAAPILPLGSGSEIVVMARQWTAPAPPPTPPATPPPTVHNPARGLTLRTIGGGMVADIEQLTDGPMGFDPCVAVRMSVNPGAYRLSLLYGDGRRIEQTLVASAGWQTQVYLLSDRNADPDRTRADVVNAAITMRRPWEKFSADDPMLRLEEITRGALADHRHALSSELRETIVRRDCPPMLALFGAHLLIREADTARIRREQAPDQKTADVDNRPALAAIATNLRETLGAHPDVEAVAIAAGRPNPEFILDAPPLLRASWPLLLGASVQRPELMPAGSFGARIAERIWGDGSWLFWVDPDADAVDRTTLWQVKAREMLTTIATPPLAADVGPTLSLPEWPTPTLSLPTAIGIPGTVVSLARAIATYAYRRIMALFTRRSRKPFPELRVGPYSAPAERVTVDLAALRKTLTDRQWQTLIETIGVPKSTLVGWLDKLEP